VRPGRVTPGLYGFVVMYVRRTQQNHLVNGVFHSDELKS
jgi:hypothetical protein